MNCILEEKLSAQCQDMILQTLAEGLFIIDKKGTIIYCNKALEQMTGRPKTQLVGQSCCTLMKEACSPPPDCSLYSRGSVTDTECSIKHISGKTIPVIKNARVLTDADGEILGAVETLTDISKLKTTEQRLTHLERQFKRRDGIGALVGRSSRMQELYSLLEMAAQSHATILISGESGTGKELAASAIHLSSSRASAPFVKVNCSAIPESLLESELFGHVRGAFTGAVKDKAGRFELADTGTLFLDEIGDISPLIQVKLLRFLQEKEYERLGESITRKADVRIISATNRDLKKLVQEGKFREDLYYRLKVFVVHIPPLRERKEDIGILIEHFIGKFNKETGKKITGVTHDSAVMLMDYSWPGNVRELENAIEHAFVTCPRGKIDVFDIPAEIRRAQMRKDANQNSTAEKNTETTDLLYPSTPRVSSEELLQTLKECNGNRSEAARKLGIDRTTLWRRINRLREKKEL
ncbi:MAG: sigma-54 interaction domain-containing protein [Chitinispirillaceae bacterium]